MIDVKELLKIGIEKGASDVHLIFRNKPLLRINKNLVEIDNMPVLTKDDMYEILTVLTDGNEEKMTAFMRDKMMDLHYDMEECWARVNASMSEETPIYTIRLIKSILPTFESLGLPDIVKNMAMQPQGLILVTGKPNSGKSTTLNALVNEINKTETKKILMLENPVEFLHQSQKSLVIQKEIGEGRDCLTFSEGARNALREDCDILVIGEIRDKGTMDAAIEMAESGHLVLGTLHTKSCAETMDRLITFYDQSEQSTIKFLVSALLKLVVSQKLVTGINGKLVLVPEIMVVDNTIGALIRRDKFVLSEIEDAIQTRTDKGNCSYIASLANLVIENKLSIEQAKEQLDERSGETLLRIIKQKRM